MHLKEVSDTKSRGSPGAPLRVCGGYGQSPY